MNSHFNQLPEEIFGEIAKNLDPTSVQRFLRTNRRLHRSLKMDRHRFAKTDVDLTINVNKEQNDQMGISIKATGFKKSMDFRLSPTGPLDDLDLYPIGVWKKYKTVTKNEEPIRVKHFSAVLDAYLGEILACCNPTSLSIYQCPTDLLKKLTDYIEAYECQVEFLELNCGKAHPRAVEGFLDSISPKRLVFRAEKAKHVSKSTYETKAFRSANELDVMVFRKVSTNRVILSSECLLSTNAPFHSTNIPIQVDNGSLAQLVTEFMKGKRDFDANLGWNIPYKTTGLNEIEVFRGNRFETKILLDNEQQPCGRLFELKRGPKTTDRLRLMWNAKSLIVNGILGTLRENVDFIGI